ncbi:MAG: MBL fold metallo-hydrolase [Myxococcales bacterium]|nr:MBL fold metallo-hydrolase [Myxococcales bacterium]
MRAARLQPGKGDVTIRSMGKSRTTDDTRIFDLPIHRSSRWIFNCYVIEGDAGESVIIDPGLASTAEGALRHLRSVGRGVDQLHSICTHGHVDHLNGMPILRDSAGARSYLPARCERYLKGESPRTFGHKVAMRFFPMVAQQPFALSTLGELARADGSIGFGGSSHEFQFPYAPDGFVGEGGSLPGASRWKVLEVPGHSDDSICFYDSVTCTLISGDAVLTHNGRAWFNPEIVDSKASAETEERLRALDVRHLLPGHGLPISGRVWDDAMSFRERPKARGLVARCLRRISG